MVNFACLDAQQAKKQDTLVGKQYQAWLPDLSTGKSKTLSERFQNCAKYQPLPFVTGRTSNPD